MLGGLEVLVIISGVSGPPYDVDVQVMRLQFSHKIALLAMSQDII